MTFPVFVMPGVILCGKCRTPMRWDDLKRGINSATGRCWNMQCEQHDVPLVYPLTVLELQKAEA